MEDDCTVISKESSLEIEAPTEKQKRATQRNRYPETDCNGAPSLSIKWTST